MMTLLRMSLSNDSSPSVLWSSVTRARVCTLATFASLTKGAERGRSGPCASIFVIQIEMSIGAVYYTRKRNRAYYEYGSVHQCIVSISEPSSQQDTLINAYLLFRNMRTRAHG